MIEAEDVAQLVHRHVGESAAPLLLDDEVGTRGDPLGAAELVVGDDPAQVEHFSRLLDSPLAMSLGLAQAPAGSKPFDPPRSYLRDGQLRPAST